MRSLSHAVASAATAAAMLLAAAGAQAQATLPIHIRNGIEYVSGGVGSSESALMRDASNHWPASLEFAVKDGRRDDFAAGVDVRVIDDAGQLVLDHVVVAGPFLLMDLDPGRYRVLATLAGQALERQIDVRAGAASHAVFVWPAGTGMRKPS